MLLSDFSGPVVRFWHTIAFGAVIMWLIVAFDGLNRFNFSNADSADLLVVRDLYYEDGLIFQSVGSRGVNPIQAKWVASIYQNGRWICGGGGDGTYNGRITGFTVDDWVGDVCDLTPGVEYEGRASWSKPDPDGGRRTIGESFTFVYSLPDVDL